MKKVSAILLASLSFTLLTAKVDIEKAILEKNHTKIEAYGEANVTLSPIEKKALIELAQEQARKAESSTKKLIGSYSKLTMLKLSVALAGAGASAIMLKDMWDDQSERESKVWKGVAFFIFTAHTTAKSWISFYEDIKKNDESLSEKEKADKVVDAVSKLSVS